MVAAYLDNSLDSVTLRWIEETCLESDAHLAEVAACHQILTLVLTEPVRVPPQAYRRMYQFMEPQAAQPGRRPNKALPVGGIAPFAAAQAEADELLLLRQKPLPDRHTVAVTAAILLLFAATATYFFLPRKPPSPPEATAGHSFLFFNGGPPREKGTGGGFARAVTTAIAAGDAARARDLAVEAALATATAAANPPPKKKP